MYLPKSILKDRSSLREVLTYVNEMYEHLALLHIEDCEWVGSPEHPDDLARAQKHVLFGLLLGLQNCHVHDVPNSQGNPQTCMQRNPQTCMQGNPQTCMQGNPQTCMQGEAKLVCKTGNLDFLLLIHIIFVNFMSKPIQRNGVSENGIQKYVLETNSSHAFQPFKELFYVTRNGQRYKRISYSIENCLNEEVIAIWFQSSGFKTKNGYSFYTGFVSETDVNFLQIVLMYVFDLVVDYEKTEVGYRYDITEPYSVNKLTSMISPYLLTSRLPFLHSFYKESEPGFMQENRPQFSKELFHSLKQSIYYSLQIFPVK